ncbi:bolA-like protein 1 [Ambystoma mexicanum]|uniref:bolA-like protein 1 n=1 Tax=Ambystoma mexicanum TaxID=8296 RepID=UPI0037E71C77
MISLHMLRSCRGFRQLVLELGCPAAFSSMDKPVESSIRTKLIQQLEPIHLEVYNESNMHSVPPGSETHFKVVVVCKLFEGMPQLQRHRLVNEALKDELAGPVHALSIQAKAPQQWKEDPSVSKSPACLGGSKNDPQMSSKLGNQA